MELKKLKTYIETKTLPDNILIFLSWDTFLAESYINAIAKQKNLSINYLSSLDIILNDYDDIFDSDIVESELNIYKCTDFACSDKSILKKKNLIIIAEKIADKDTLQLLDDIIIKAPKIQPKYIEEYVKNEASGLKDSQVKWLIDACNSNLYRIQQELDKLKLFGNKNQDKLFDNFMLDGIFDDLSTDTILTFIEAIMTKNIKTLTTILSNIKNIDIEPLGVITLLYRNITLILNVQFNRDITAEELNIKPGYLYMLRKKSGYYSKDQLINAFDIVTKLEYKLKQGEIAENNIIDYILVNML